MLAYYKKENKF